VTDDALAAIARWHADGVPAVLATVVRTSGSVPRPVGGKLAISADLQLAGSVSGGCVEGDVVRHASEVLTNGQARLVPYGISDEAALTVGLMCGGEIQVLIEPVDDTLAAQLAEFQRAMESGRPVARIMSVGGPALGTRRVEVGHPTVLADDEVADMAMPSARVWIVGAGHVAEHNAAFAARCGMSVIVIDPRHLFAGQQRLLDVRVVEAWPDTVLSADALDAHDAVVVLTHDPKLDIPALSLALRSQAGYVGAIGSRAAQSDRRDRLQAAGLRAEEIGRLHAPIGLDLGGGEPAEIALAIVAQIIASQHGRTLGEPER
jgi:xanthine dehydrogenase accessory factor